MLVGLSELKWIWYWWWNLHTDFFLSRPRFIGQRNTGIWTSSNCCVEMGIYKSMHSRWVAIWVMEKSMALCKTAVTPLLMHLSHCSLALSHRNMVGLVGILNTWNIDDIMILTCHIQRSHWVPELFTSLDQSFGLTLKQLGHFFFEIWFYFLVLLTLVYLDMIYMYITGPIFSHRCGFCRPGAPGHQGPQCWICTHAFPAVYGLIYSSLNRKNGFKFGIIFHWNIFASVWLTQWSTLVQVRDWCHNTFRLRQNSHHFSDDVFKCIFLNENVWISNKISLKFVPKGSITISQHWFRKWLGTCQVTSHCLNQCWHDSLMHIYSTSERWVNP